MRPNTVKITSAILLIISAIAGIYYYNYYKNSEKKAIKVSNINDAWEGESYSEFKNIKVVEAKEYMVSTSDPLASNVGKEILEKGGNAIDAAIAVQMVLNVVEPQSSGIGGGGFLLYYNAKLKESRYFNGRETAPYEANSKIFLDSQSQPMKFHDAVKGGLSVGTPGLLKMLKEVHDKYGQLPWKDLFTPAINLAENGFEMNKDIYTIASDLTYLKNFKNISELYFKSDGTPKDLGEIIKNQEIANSFKIIANEGIDSFYEGEIAKDIVKAARNSEVNPGYLSLDDLKQYKIKEGELVCGIYRIKYKICSMPLPSSGGVTLLQIMGILENFDLSSLKPSSLKAIHLISEATRLAYADRNKYLADVDDVPIDQMLSKNYLKSRSNLIDINKAVEQVFPGDFEDNQISYLINNNALEMPSTTHISIIDKEGNAVSFTSSIEYLFGSALMVRGFLLNNQLTDFSFIDEVNGHAVANRLEPGKQPRSSMTPTFVFDDKDNLIMIVGSPGGPRIIQFVAKTIIAYLDWNMNIQEAISLPNFTTLRDVTELEKRTDLEKIKLELENIGHKVKIKDITSGINSIVIDNNRLSGGADPRRGGVVFGK